MPRQRVTLLEGESLVNDATALVAYRLAVGELLCFFDFVAELWLHLKSTMQPRRPRACQEQDICTEDDNMNGQHNSDMDGKKVLVGREEGRK